MSTTMTMEHAKRHCADASGISNVAYDALAILTNKLQGIAAIEEYKLDAREAGDQQFLDVLQDLERRACEDVVRLQGLAAAYLA
ncbi:MAG: hypothetical protein WEC79_06860 [Thermomicrobiales bacterium]